MILARIKVFAEVLDALSIMPRFLIGTYTVLLYQIIHWFMALADPTMAQAGLVSVMTGVGAAWFGLYLGRNKYRSEK